MDIGKIGAANNYTARFYQKRQTEDSEAFCPGRRDFTKPLESSDGENGKAMGRNSAGMVNSCIVFDTGKGIGIRNKTHLQEESNKNSPMEGDTIHDEESLSESLIGKLRERMDEILTMIKNGDTEPSYQIGGQSFTIKEWDRLIEEYDSIEDAIKAALEAAKEGKAAKEDEVPSKASDAPIDKTDGEAITSESTLCTYPPSQEGDEKRMYITWYSPEGIYCKQGGIGDEFLWHIEFTDSSQYGKVMDFLRKFDSDDNLRFASNEHFWRDFLDDKIDAEEFKEYFYSAQSTADRLKYDPYRT